MNGKPNNDDRKPGPGGSRARLTPQKSLWLGEFGDAYRERNPGSLDELEERGRRAYGVTRTEMNAEFLSDLPRDLRILEVGCNLATQILALRAMDFTDLTGLELNPRTAAEARSRASGIEILDGDGHQLPFDDAHFDLVFTSGVLIHNAPEDLPRITSEIHRCSSSYIWGFEYFSESPEPVEYRGHEHQLWKRDFAGFYLETYADLLLVKRRKFKYLESENVDEMFLLQKS